MDILTHFLFGTLLGTFLDMEKQLILLLGVSSIAPDIDMLSMLFGIKSYFRFHRGLFHSFIGAFFISLIIVLIYSTLFIKIDWQQVLLIAVLGSISHLSLDIISPWKLPLFYPFRDKISFDMFYYFDIMILIPLVAANLMLYTQSLTESQKLTAIAVCFIVLTLIAYVRFYERSLASKCGKPLPTMKFDTWYSVDEKDDKIKVYKVRSGHVLDEWTFRKPIIGAGMQSSDPEEKAVSYSMESEIVKSFLTRARYPVVEVENAGGDYIVTWSDVIFKIERASIINGVKVKVFKNGEMRSEILRRY